MAKRKLPSLPDVKKLIGDNYARFVAAITTVQPLVYKALITQAGTAAPTAKILKNTLGATPVWAYSGVGVYTLTLASAFTADKTAISLGGQIGVLNKANVVRTSANVLTLSTSVLSESSNVLIATATNALLTDMLIEVVVYP